jgi:hypothetical protein
LNIRIFTVDVGLNLQETFQKKIPIENNTHRPNTEMQGRYQEQQQPQNFSDFVRRYQNNNQGETENEGEEDFPEDNEEENGLVEGDEEDELIEDEDSEETQNVNWKEMYKNKVKEFKIIEKELEKVKKENKILKKKVKNLTSFISDVNKIGDQFANSVNAIRKRGVNLMKKYKSDQTSSSSSSPSSSPS